MDVVWNHVFDKPEGSDTNKQDNGQDNKESGMFCEGGPNGDYHGQMPPLTPFQGSRWMPRTYTKENPSHLCMETFATRPETSESNFDDAARRVRVEVPDFHGKLDPYAFQDWITFLEDYFNWFSLAANRRVRFVKMKLKGHARVWWQSVEEHLHCLQKPPITDWEKMRLKLQEKYLPIDYEEMLFEELLLLRQGNTTVDDYTNKFHELSIQIRVSETECQSIARYKAGLRDDIKEEFTHSSFGEH